MYRNLLTLLFAIPALWLSIYVFGWIVTGDIHLPGFRAQREERAARFWLNIVVLALLSMVLFCLAIAIFLGILLHG